MKFSIKTSLKVSKYESVKNDKGKKDKEASLLMLHDSYYHAVFTTYITHYLFYIIFIIFFLSSFFLSS